MAGMAFSCLESPEAMEALKELPGWWAKALAEVSKLRLGARGVGAGF
jgi:hypothetical protein